MALDWTREELILALELYFAFGTDVTGSTPTGRPRRLRH
jgi:hypothetical protein